MDVKDIGFFWLRMGTSDGLLWTRWWTITCHETETICLPKT